MAKIGSTDLALVTARVKCCRLGAARLGFTPYDVKGPGQTYPCDYMWREVKPPTTQWTLQTEGVVCGKRPVASFSNVLCNAVGPVSFTDTSTPAEQITFWYWDFGDGGTSNDQNPTHTYAAGFFTVTLYVSGDKGTSSATGYVSVMSALVASADPNPTSAGQDVTFTPTFTGGLAPYTYQWQFEVDTLWDDLVAYWNLNEASGTRRDARGEIHLLPINAPGAVAGKGGNAATFDPASDHYLQSTQQANISGVNGITFTCWLNIRTGAPTNAAWFKNGEVFTSYMLFNTTNSNARFVAMSFLDDAGGGSVAGQLVAAFDTWYFVCAKFDPATLKTSISIDDGAFTLAAVAASTYPTIGTGLGNGHVDVGGTERGSVRSKSYIDEIGLWSRILTAGEITALYAAGAGKFYPGSTEEIPVYAYPTSGAKVASVTVTSATGCTASDTVDVTVSDFSVTVSAAQIEGGTDGDAVVEFDYVVTGGTDPYTYSLAWTGGGDGGPAAGLDPTVTFTGGVPLALDTIPYTLTVTDDNLLVATYSGTVDIQYWDAP